MKLSVRTYRASLLLSALALLFAACALSAEHSAPESKHVVIDQTEQVLRAYEGDRMVFESRVSTGRRNWTPNGNYQVRGKERMRYSIKYHNAPMPYSLHLEGNYFIHGYTHVPDHPASYGCIRLPLVNGNPAKTFYEWAEIGTPVIIRGQWVPPS